MSAPYLPAPARPSNGALVFRKISLILMLINVALPIIGVVYAPTTFEGGSDASLRGVVVLLSTVGAGFIGAAFWAILYLITDYVTRHTRIVRKSPAKKTFGILALVSALAAPVLAALLYLYAWNLYEPVVLFVLGFYGFYGFGLAWNLLGRTTVAPAPIVTP